MIWDINFGDGTTIRAKGETFHCACIVAQAQRVMFGETHEQELAVVRGTPVEKSGTGNLKPESTMHVDPGKSRDETAIEVRCPDESTAWTFDKSETASLFSVIHQAIKSKGPVRILIKKGDEL